jgi:hypothetical protein
MLKEKHLHLLVATITIIIVAIAYGGMPAHILPFLFDIHPAAGDLKHVFRAIMGLYLGMAIFWLYGIFNASYWRSATISNILCMAGLASGRILSLILDGIPSRTFLVGIGLEVVFAIWGILNLWRYADAKR